MMQEPWMGYSQVPTAGTTGSCWGYLVHTCHSGLVRLRLVRQPEFASPGTGVIGGQRGQTLGQTGAAGSGDLLYEFVIETARDYVGRARHY